MEAYRKDQEQQAKEEAEDTAKREAKYALKNTPPNSWREVSSELNDEEKALGESCVIAKAKKIGD